MRKQDIIDEVLEIGDLVLDNEILTRLTVNDLKIIRHKLAVFAEDVLCRQKFTKSEREEIEGMMK